MKRFLICCLGIVACLFLNQTTVYADTQDVTEGDQLTVICVDASDEILKTGGLLPTEYAIYVEAPEKMLSNGTRTITADAKQTLYEGLMARKQSIDLTSFKLTADEAKELYPLVTNEHPDMIFVTGYYKLYTYSSGLVAYIEPTYNDYTEEDVETLISKCQSVVNAMVSTWTTEEKLLYLHDYVVTHCDYDLSLTKFNAYNVMVEGTAVCQGYSEAMRLLGYYAGIEIKVVTSRVLGHAWNMVNVDGMDYFIDCTWDDPVGDGEDPNARWYPMYCDHANFLRSRAGFLETGHGQQNIYDDAGNCVGYYVADDWTSTGIGNVYQYGLSSTKYDSCFWIKDLSPIPYLNGSYSYMNFEDLDHVYFKQWNAAEQTVSLPEQAGWPVWNAPQTYVYSYASFASYDGAFYFSSEDKIYRLGLDGSIELVYELSNAEKQVGYIYGIQANDQGLYYWLGHAPSMPSMSDYVQKTLKIEASEPSDIIKISINHALSLDNNLAISYLIDEDSLKDYTNLRLVAKRRHYKNGSSEYSIVTTELIPETVSSYGGYVQFKYRGIAAKEMGENVEAVLYATKGDTEYHTAVDNYGVSAYAYRMIRKSSTSSKLKTLLVDMLNYGALAQEYFHCNQGNLVNAGLESDELLLGTQGDITLKSHNKVTTTQGATLSIYGKGLTSEDSIEIKYYITIPDTYDMSKVRLELEYQDIKKGMHYKTIQGTDFGSDLGYRTAVLDEIAAKDAGQVVTATLYEDTETVACIHQYSIETYCYNKTKNSTTDERELLLQELCRAMMKYCKTAAQYF